MERERGEDGFSCAFLSHSYAPLRQIDFPKFFLRAIAGSLATRVVARICLHADEMPLRAFHRSAYLIESSLGAEDK
jgi:hypothetical protein